MTPSRVTQALSSLSNRTESSPYTLANLDRSQYDLTTPSR